MGYIRALQVVSDGMDSERWSCATWSEVWYETRRDECQVSRVKRVKLKLDPQLLHGLFCSVPEPCQPSKTLLKVPYSNSVQ
jgi:hypothetical protein